MNQSHTVRSYERELEDLRQTVADMASVVSEEVAQALRALSQRDGVAAEALTTKDEVANALERDIDEKAIRMIALRHPMAGDLRVIIAALRIATDLERIGDYAKNIAKHTVSIATSGSDESVESVVEMGQQVADMVPDAVRAFLDRDEGLANAVRARDTAVDKRHTDLFRDLLTRVSEGSADVTAATHLMFIARCLERLGDHATNIADHALYLVDGTIPADDREKADQAAYVVVS
ncbi:phosphate signaling complex protein PhoU [Magnetospira sp. QH-2]|uniref:phosphate signaling complex protein PhoU n=1 Tax=Magnetospira sp. (strain QH-2) TaxID=1288970 RepID=UPI0003E814F2|nr:phosphate signaling complex protein PhoU [Magnetospira sp. QH-2]CCQ72390.1 negative regulator ABC phosphate transport [Magnetospira sp. QH-2]